MTARLCVFDCDGTLVDSQYAIIASMAAAFAAHGLPRPEDGAVRRVVGLALLEAVAMLLPAADAELQRRVARSYSDAFGELRRGGGVREPMFPGLNEALAALEAEGWLLGIATGKSLRGLKNTLAVHGLEGRFVTLQTVDTAPGKPHPGMLLQAMAEAGATPERTVMVGDTSFDMLMAREAGTFAIGVAWGYHDRDTIETAGAHRLIEAYQELPGAIGGLLDLRQAS
ncbi:MAG: HAD family hydrolase [Rhodospirillales bacterium]|nr:MAG: HAD family hydrolase [Rhodospirillales bacterium]